MSLLPHILAEERFSSRKASFTIREWGVMPVELSPLKCASRGWMMKEPQSLECEFCKSQLNVILPSRDRQFYLRRVKECSSNLIESHTETCIFRTTQCPESFCTPGLNGDTQIENYILKTSHEIDEQLQSLGKFEIKQVEIEDNIKLSENLKVSSQSLQAALNGWSLKTVSAGVSCLYCEICSRKLPLWKSQPTKQEGSSPVTVDLDSHLVWCPWIYSETRKCFRNRSQEILKQLNVRKRKSLDKTDWMSEERTEQVKSAIKFMKASPAPVNTSS